MIDHPDELAELKDKNFTRSRETTARRVTKR